MPTKIVSFGHRYQIPEDGEIIDVRSIFHHPYSKMRTGLQEDIATIIENKYGFEELYIKILEAVRKLPGVVYIGCHDGQHRSVYLAQRLADDLKVPVTHRDIVKNVLRYRNAR